MSAAVLAQTSTCDTETLMLSCRGLSVVRGRKRVLNTVSINLHPGEILGVLGANGAGKSTLLSALAGELVIDPTLHMRCPVNLNGLPLVHMTHAELARARAVLPQQPGLRFDLGVDDVVSMGLYPFPEISRKEGEALCDEAIALADIGPLWRRRYLELSGGEQQRVQFARVLLQLTAAGHAEGGARYLFLDEPSSSLDPAHQHGLLRVVREMAHGEGVGVMVVLHDVNLAAQYCDRLALMAHGGILECGPPAKVLQPQALKRVYGAEAHVQAHPVHAGVPLVVFL